MEVLYRILGALLFSGLLFNATAQSNEDKKYPIEKTKTFEQRYDLSQSDKVVIHNQFGKVNVTTWEKAEILVTATIIVGGKTESKVNDLLDEINVESDKSDGVVQYKTKIGSGRKKNWSNDGNATSMKINYEVHLPAAQTLKLSNEFGPIVLPDYQGVLNLVSKFGSLTAGRILNTEKILIEFGKADIKALTSLDATFKFSTINILDLEGTNELEYEFCKASKLGLAANLKGLQLKQSYSKLYIQPNSALSASYNIKSSFGSVSSRVSALALSYEKEENDYSNSREYVGKSGSGEVKIRMKSSFGKIVIGEPSATELEEKKKKKNNEEDDDDND